MRRAAAVWWLELLRLGLGAAVNVTDICGHGTFDHDTFRCICDENWVTSGPTDPLYWLRGECYQYRCTSDELCSERLGIAGATCPVKDWGCYCGWAYAFENLFEGFRSGRPNGAACQGVLVTASLSGSYALWRFLETVWFYVLVLAALVTPFGQTHVRCRCHDPSMFRLATAVFRAVWGSSPCDGRCRPENFSRGMFFNDFAWSVFVIDLGIWFYAFLIILYLMAALVWCILVWLLAIFALLCLLLMVLAGGAGGDAGCECGGGPSCGDCVSMDLACPQCADCCLAPVGTPNSLDIFYTGGPMPVGDNCCSCSFSCNRRGVCWPLAWLFLYFPRHPANFWGGLFGLCLGTHQLCPRYQGGSRVVDFFSLRPAGDLHGLEDWRRQVHDLLTPPNPDGPPMQQQMQGQPAPAAAAAWPSSRALGGLGTAHGVNVIEVADHFKHDRDNLRESSWLDYENRSCWICRNVEEPTWDLWLQCGHLFCSRCSEEMLQRRMPCPLCRQVSFCVKRGPASYRAPAAAAAAGE